VAWHDFLVWHGAGVFLLDLESCGLTRCGVRSDKAVTGVSTYNVVPDKMAYYFNKIQCFCFEEQRLRGREVVDMPVFFYIDPEVPCWARVCVCSHGACLWPD
jgi:hypothetical protein